MLGFFHNPNLFKLAKFRKLDIHSFVDKLKTWYMVCLITLDNPSLSNSYSFDKEKCKENCSLPKSSCFSFKFFIKEKEKNSKY